MICEECREAGLRSIVRVDSSKQSKMASQHFFDEQGQEHSHNPNVAHTFFRCSNGHRFEETSSWECFCGWKVCEAKIHRMQPGAPCAPVKEAP